MVLMAVLALAACASQPRDQLMLMPAPDVFDQGDWDPFTDRDPVADIPYGGMLYATDRQPAREEKGYYLDDRGHVLRLGRGRVTLGRKGMTWEEARRISLLKERPEDYPLRVTGVQEVGILASSINAFTEDLVDHNADPGAGEPFAAMINAKLAISKVKDIFIYVHGYKVVFENPLLVASELWHFLGYEGVFIAFAWPSTPSTLAYFSDLETAALSAANLRLLLQYLAEETDARRIHIIGYSAGTRLVTQALHQLALMAAAPGCREPARDWRIGHVILTGSDVDRHLFGAYLVDGILDVAQDIAVYASAKDSALGMSTWVFGRERLGQLANKDLPEVADRYLRQNGNLIIVNATDAPGAATGNGHAYFRQSPWTSSDILVTLAFDLNPRERGLEMGKDRPFWNFPPDYIDRLRTALSKIRSH
jgi:esterase/lipase superfamily enzyme